MHFMHLTLNSSSVTCSICALGVIILQLVAIECQKLHIVESPVGFVPEGSVLKRSHVHLEATNDACARKLRRESWGGTRAYGRNTCVTAVQDLDRGGSYSIKPNCTI